MSQPLFLFLCVAVAVFAGCVVLWVSERATCKPEDDSATCWPLFAHLGENEQDAEESGVSKGTEGWHRV